tara:strand:+ start:1899 stop:3008 length:1110 start_codon:yes stop_codon:yes gene_type:complete
MDNNNIYIHIGSGKTGTTSLQKYLYENKEYLNKNNYIYPEPYEDIINGQYKNAGNIIKRLINFEDINKILIEYKNLYQKKNIVLSDEAFIHTYDENKILLYQLKNIDPSLNVTLIVYYRRIIEFMVTNWSQKNKERLCDFQQGVKNFDSKNHKLAKVSLEKSLKNIDKYHSSAINILKQIEELSHCKNIKIKLKPYSSDQLLNNIIQDDFVKTIGLKVYTKKYKNENKKNIMNKSVTREMSDLLQLRNKIFEPNRSIIANNIVGRFFKFNQFGEPTYFLGKTSLVESISDSTIKYICDLFFQRELKVFRRITGNDVFFKSIYPKCYGNNRKKYRGISFEDKKKFFKFLVLENKLTKKEIILVIYYLFRL